MRLDASTGWLAGVRCVPSPNCDARPDPSDISLLVIHGISLPPGQYGGPYINDLFLNRLNVSAHPYFEHLTGVRVSAHALIRRDGELTQYVSFLDRAWHAGPSCYCARESCNDYSIGIELEGQDEEFYTDPQYAQLQRVARLLIRAWPGITIDRIVGHCDIAPGRKTDPGTGFDWPRFRGSLGGSTQGRGSEIL